MPAMRATSLVSKVVPKIWESIGAFRPSRSSYVFLIWEEATDLVWGDNCLNDYVNWTNSKEGRRF